MKKIFTLALLCIAGFANWANAQTNLVSAPGFETDPKLVTVSGDLYRVASLYPKVTTSGNPTATSVSVSEGMWVKKAMNSGYIVGKVVATQQHEGANSLNLKITQNTTAAGLQNWYGCVVEQRVSLANNKKYSASFWAMTDPSAANNQCDSVTVFVCDTTSKVSYAIPVELTGGTAWTQYTVNFDIPAYVATHPTAVFTTAFFGLGISTNYDGLAKTLNSSVFVDDISLIESITSGINSPNNGIKPITVLNDGIVSNVNGTVQVISYSGKTMENIKVTNGQFVAFKSGAYVVRVTTGSDAFIQKVVL